MLRILVISLLGGGVTPVTPYRDGQGNMLCGGTTLAEYTGWSPYIVDHMVLGFDAKVDASGCAFGDRQPHFFVSLVEGSADGSDGDGDRFGDGIGDDMVLMVGATMTMTN